MKPNDSLFNQYEVQRIKRMIKNDHRWGITKRLLEKYKPSRCLRIIEDGKEELKKERAA